jgi:capsular polysaccharide biosynthesis protein
MSFRAKREISDDANEIPSEARNDSVQQTMQDTRNYFATITRRWRFVIAMPLLAMVSAALVTFALKPTYEATALIALAPTTLSIPTSSQLPPYYLMVDSPRRLPIAFTPAYYIAILKDARIVDQVAPRVPVTLAANASDRALIEITARGEDAQLVAATANAWARVGAQSIEQLLMPSGDDVIAAQKKLDAAEQDLVKFARENGMSEYDPTKLNALTGLTTAKRLELNQLLRARDTAEEVYRDFARESARAAILATTATKPRVIAASVPSAPVAPKLAQNVLIGAAFGLLVGVAGAFALEWLARKNVKTN